MWHREVTIPASGATVDVLFLDTEVRALLLCDDRLPSIHSRDPTSIRTSPPK